MDLLSFRTRTHSPNEVSKEERDIIMEKSYYVALGSSCISHPTKDPTWEGILLFLYIY